MELEFGATSEDGRWDDDTIKSRLPPFIACAKRSSAVVADCSPPVPPRVGVRFVFRLIVAGSAWNVDDVGVRG